MTRIEASAHRLKLDDLLEKMRMAIA